MSQLITSAKTSLRQVPALVKIGDGRGFWRPGTRNLDLGGGAYDLTTEALAFRGVYSRVADPYNRTEAHNRTVGEWVMRSGGVDTVTCCNVLNVIDDDEAIGNIIDGAFTALNRTGVAYFTVYEGTGSGVGSATSKGWQNNRPLKAYFKQIEARFGSGNVVRKALVIIATKGTK